MGSLKVKVAKNSYIMLDFYFFLKKNSYINCVCVDSCSLCKQLTDSWTQAINFFTCRHLVSIVSPFVFKVHAMEVREIAIKAKW